MWMTDYIREIQRQLVTEYNMNPDSQSGLPQNVPDGEYPMTIEGRVDNVRIINGAIHCCRFADQK